MRKILLALDCSPNSRRAAEYLASWGSELGNCQITLFSVLTGIPYKNAQVSERQSEVHGDLDHQQEVAEIDAFLGEVQTLLHTAGLPENRVEMRKRCERRGLAQDILDAAIETGCDTVVVGRRGLSRLRKMLEGSVSRDLVQQAETVTIWVVA